MLAIDGKGEKFAFSASLPSWGHFGFSIFSRS